MIPLWAQILIALAMDHILGDPPGWPHPVRWIGALAAKVEAGVRPRIHNQGLAGGLGLILVLAVTAVVSMAFLMLLGRVHVLAADVGAILMLWTTLATKDLRLHSLRVHWALKADNLGQARQAVSMLVGRETSELQAPEVSRACVESVAENSVDGVIAPLFFAFVAGPVGAMLYKAVNTLDSMWGYMTGGYKDFGRSAARLDDILNWVPARLGALALLASGWIYGHSCRQGWHIFRRDRGKHPSPNGGQVEAAVAGLLGVQLGGESRYHGQVSQRPRLGDPTRPVQPEHIVQTNKVVQGGVYLVLGVMLAVYFSLGVVWF